jgi:prevent-host-death family protein
MKTITAGEFKAKCLSLLDEVNHAHETVIVTKRGHPVAMITPVSKKKAGCVVSLKGSVLSEKNIVNPIGGAWEARIKL